MKSQNAKFLENVEPSGTVIPQEVAFEEILEHATLSSFIERMIILSQNRSQNHVLTPIQE